MINKANAILYYVHDPMCSWCWGFHKTWSKVEAILLRERKLHIEYLVGGLAPDSNDLMSDELQSAILSYWQRIQEHIPGTKFNYDFWKQCQPRRSTYPSCRAVLTAKRMYPSKEKAMILGIQQAYYLNVQNPSDEPILINIAASIGLDKDLFAEQLNSGITNKMLSEQLRMTHELGARSFPSLILKIDEQVYNIPHDYNSVKTNVSAINQYL